MIRFTAGVALGCVALACAGALLFPAAGPTEGEGLLVRALCHWDSNWYAMIARGGYWYQPGQQSPVAFFPAFPLVVSAVSVTGLGPFAAEILVSLACGQGALFVFYRWATLRSDAATARDALFVAALFPLAFFLYGVGYSDALFMLLAVGAFYALERDRPLVAMALGVAATACRPVAPAIVLGLLTRSVERRVTAKQPLRVVDLAPALSGLGLALYMAHLHFKVGDALAFAHVQSAPGWDQPPGWHTWLKVTFIDAFKSHRLTWPEQARLIGHASVAATGVLLLWPTFKRQGFGYAVYATCALVIPIIGSKDFIGLGRYAFAAFPLFLTAAQLLCVRRPVLRTWWVISAALLGVLAFQFGAGGYLS